MSNKLIDLNALSSYKTQSDLKYQDKLTVGSGISIDANNVISAKPTFLQVIGSGTISVPSATLTQITEITLQPGIYIIRLQCIFSSDASGYRQCGFSTNTTDISGLGLAWYDERRAVSGIATIAEVNGVYEFSEEDYPNGRTFYALVYQNSGSTLTITPRLEYIKF